MNHNPLHYVHYSGSSAQVDFSDISSQKRTASGASLLRLLHVLKEAAAGAGSGSTYAGLVAKRGSKAIVDVKQR